MREYNDMKPARIVGSFMESRNQDFNDSLVALNENFKGSYGLDAVDDTLRILKDDVMYEQYREMLIGDVLDTEFEDRYLSLLPDKIDQVMENSRQEIINEAYGVAQLLVIRYQ